MPMQPAVLGTARLGNFRLGYQSAALRRVREARARITLDGVDVKTRVRLRSVTIHDALNDAPNTCDLSFEGTTPPTVGQSLRVSINANAPRLLFSGELQTVQRTYASKPRAALLVYPATAVDDGVRASRRRPLGVWTNISGTTVAIELMAGFAPGFTTAGVEAGLPAISVTLDGSEGGMMGCLAQVVKLIAGYFYFEDRDLHLFRSEATETPLPLDDTPKRFLNYPPLQITTDKSQVRTRVFGKGARTALLGDVEIGATLVPVADASIFNAAIGGKVIGGVTPDAAASQILAYTGAQEGGGGALIGTGAGPSGAPNLALQAGAGVESGLHGYATTFVTAAGESLPGPVAQITVGPQPTTTVADRTAPTATPTLHILEGGGNGPPDELGNWRAKVNFVYADGGKSLPSPQSGTVNVTDNTGPFWQGVYAQNVQTGPSGVVRRDVYLKAPSTGTFRLFQNINDNTSSYSITYAPQVSGGAAAPTTQTYDATTTILFVNDLSIFPASGQAIVGSDVFTYTSKSASSGVGSLQGITGISGTITSGDTITPYPVGGNQVALSAIPIGGASVTNRKIYRTVAGGSQLKLMGNMGDNTTTTYLDANADAGLSANAPTSDASGLTQPTGQVSAGSTTIPVANVGAFAAGGGWALIGDLAVRYTGVSASGLTGVPASGNGALLASIAYNASIIAAPVLTGVTGVVLALAKGAPIHVWVQRDDLAAQAIMAALDGGDGIYEHILSDERRTEASLAALCDAELAQFSRPLITVTYDTRDVKTKSGKPIAVSLTSPAIVETLTIQDVTITEIDIAPGMLPRFSATASSLRVSLDDILRNLIAKAGA
jgi:hypothetical protein